LRQQLLHHRWFCFPGALIPRPWSIRWYGMWSVVVRIWTTASCYSHPRQHVESRSCPIFDIVAKPEFIVSRVYLFGYEIVNALLGRWSSDIFDFLHRLVGFHSGYIEDLQSRVCYNLKNMSEYDRRKTIGVFRV